MKTTWIFIVIAFITVYVIDFTLSQGSTQNGNPDTANNVSSVSDTTNNVNTLDKPTDKIAKNGNAGNSSPINKPPNRRRIRQRRRRRKRKNNNNKKAKNNSQVSKAPLVENTTKTLSDVTVDTSNLVSEVPTNLTPLPKEAKPVQKALTSRKKSKKKPAENSVDQSDSFFDFFNEQTTTVAPDTNAAPPSFDPNKKPGNKTLPTVDPSKAISHDGRLCNETYKPHNATKYKYMMKYAEGVWETLDCPPNLADGLVWRQDLCACGEELIPQDPNDWCGQLGYNYHPQNKHKYLRRHHGADAVMECAASLVWSQDKCQCIYDPTVIDRPIEQKVTFVCKTILHLQFEGNLTNTADGYHVKTVQLNRRGLLPRIRFMKTRGASGKAAMIVSQPLEFQAFRGNDFQTQVTYSLNFKLSPKHQNRKKFMTLLTDECHSNFGRQNKERKPTFDLTFQPSSRSFRLQFRTDMAEVDQLIKGAIPDNDGWYKTVVYLEDATVNLENNGRKLFTIADIFGKIPQNKCPLFIAGRGRGFDRSKDFYGYMDNVFLVKDCKFHEANIKFL